VLTDKLEVKRLTFLDVIKEQAAQDAETAADQFDTDFALMTGELQRFIPALVDALGGEIEEDDE
jgi:recombination associated protein RdgC